MIDIQKNYFFLKRNTQMVILFHQLKIDEVCQGLVEFFVYGSYFHESLIGIV